MFRLAPVVLLVASLSSVVTAQAADLAVQKNPVKADPAVNGSANHAPIDGEEPNGSITVITEPSEPKPIGVASLKMSMNGLFVHAYVHSSQPGFVGVVGLSLTRNLTYSFGLPPLLTDSVVMAFGATDTQDLGLRSQLSSLPIESITVFGQALVIDEKGLWSSNVVGLTIGGHDDGNPPANGSQTNADLPAPVTH